VKDKIFKYLSYSLAGLILLWPITLYLRKEIVQYYSSDFNDKLASEIDLGKTQMQLSRLYEDQWDKICILEQYHNARNGLYYCSKDETGLNYPYRDYSIIPFNYEAGEGQNGLIFVSGKEARIIVPNPDLTGVYSDPNKENSFIEVRVDKTKLYGKQHFLSLREK
jgi:hypothetical protein